MSAETPEVPADEAEREARSVVTTHRDPSEIEFVRLLVLCPDARPEAQELLEQGFVADEWLAGIARKVVGAGTATGSALYATVAEKDRAVGELLSEWLVDQRKPAELQYVVRRLLLELTERGLERKRRALRASMRNAETAGDTTGLDRLFRETAQIDKQLSDVRTRLFNARRDEHDHASETE